MRSNEAGGNFSVTMSNVPSSSQNDGVDRGDFINRQFQGSSISPEMLNFGLSAGQKILSQQQAKWMPGVSDFWTTLKIYFAVSNSYVLRKIFIVIYPMRNQTWGRMPADEAGGEVSRALSVLTLFFLI